MDSISAIMERLGRVAITTCLWSMILANSGKCVKDFADAAYNVTLNYAVLLRMGER